MSEKVVMNKEILEKLKGFSAATGAIPFCMEIEGVPEQFWPTFKLDLMTDEQREEYEAVMHNEDISNLERGRKIRDILLVNISGWENVYDLTEIDVQKLEEAKPTPFTKKKVKTLQLATKILIAQEITRLSGYVAA